MRHLILCSFALLLAGCVTTDSGNSLDNQRIANLCGRAAYIGGTLYLKANPEDRGRFEMAVTALKVVEGMANPDASALAEALKGLPVTELKGDDGWLIVEAACALWDVALASRVPLDRPELVKRCVPQIRSGIERALAATR